MAKLPRKKMTEIIMKNLKMNTVGHLIERVGVSRLSPLNIIDLINQDPPCQELNVVGIFRWLMNIWVKGHLILHLEWGHHIHLDRDLSTPILSLRVDLEKLMKKKSGGSAGDSVVKK